MTMLDAPSDRDYHPEQFTETEDPANVRVHRCGLCGGSADTCTCYDDEGETPICPF